MTFLLASVGGTLIGYVIGVVVHWMRRRLHDSVLESGLGMLLPFGAYLIGESAGASGVLAVVAAGLYLGHNAPRAGYATRLQETAVWGAVDALLESWVFGLIGLQLLFVLADSGATWPLFGAALLVLLVAAPGCRWHQQHRRAHRHAGRGAGGQGVGGAPGRADRRCDAGAHGDEGEAAGRASRQRRVGTPGPQRGRGRRDADGPVAAAAPDDVAGRACGVRRGPRRRGRSTTRFSAG